MSGRTRLLCAFVCLGAAWAADSKDKSVGNKPNTQPPAKSAQLDLSAAPQKKPRIDYASQPLSFEPNRGQSDAAARFTAKSHGYTLQLDPTGARFQFPKKGKKPSTLRMDLENANGQAAITGESPLPGKANYFPTSDPKTWVANVPTYSRVHYRGVYPGVDLAFYGTANRLEYDFLIDPGADPKQIRMSLSGSQFPSVNNVGDLVVSEDKASVHFLKPLAYQLASDGKTRVPVDARYDLEKKANGEALVTLALGKYDHSRQLIIDPVVDALSYSQYLLGYTYVGSVAVDSSGNSYVTGSAYPSYNSTLSRYYAFEVTKFNSSGAVVYTSTYGISDYQYTYPQALAIDSSGNAYVTGFIQGAGTEYAYATVPTTSNALQTTAGTSYYEAFLAVIPASGGTPTYCTYLAGTDTDYSWGTGVAVDSTGKVYVAGYTSSVTFPTTAGVYQPTLAVDNYATGFVSKFDPTKSGAASLIYSTFLGSTNDTATTYLSGIAVDSSGDAYVAAYSSNSTYPVTSGAFQYTGIESTSGGAYVTELNPTATALAYSAYLGPGAATGIEVDGASAAYVTGTVSYADFPTTAGAYQTDFASGFAVKLNAGGATEAYSTFLSGPSGVNYDAIADYPTISLPKGCASSCNAYIAGQTASTDFPAINAIQSTASPSGGSAFIVELNSTGTSALFSSYLGGNNAYVYPAANSALYGYTPGIAVDSSGNIYVAGNTNSTTANTDFPITIPDANSSQAFLAKISTTASAGFTVVQPTTVAFGNQTVGVSTSISNGTATARLSNFSSANVTLGTITVSPSSIFSASVTAGSPGSSADCATNIVPAGGYCILDLNFTPTTAGARAGTVTIASNASNTPATLALTGTGVDQAFGQASQSSLTFSAVVGTPSAAQSVVITNLGDVTEPLTSSGYPYLSQGVNFTQINNCPTYLLPGASCTVNVTFAPTQPGLLTDTLQFYNPGSGWTYISLTGTATVAGASTGLTFSLPSIQFGPQTQYTTSSPQYLYVTNSGTIPVVIQSYTASNLSFQVSNYNCGTVPFQINPGSSCYVEVQFTPQTAGSLTGNLAIVADGNTTNVPLSGTGVASNLNVEFYPSSAVSFPDTPVNTTSGTQLIYFYNTGSAPLTLDRVVVSGNFSIYNTSCEGATVNGVVPDGLGTGGYCYVNVQFTPASVAQGLTGALTFYYSVPGSSTVTQASVTLAGNGIAASGTIGLDPYSLNFGSQPQGVTSAVQNIYLQNPGNTPVTVNSFTFTGTDASDYSVASQNCGSLPYTISAGQGNCYVSVQFTPGGTGTRGPATLNVASSAGAQTASLTGTGVAATQVIGLTPTSMNLGPIVVGQSSQNQYLYLRNTGTETVTFSASPTITGTNAADFSATPYYCYVSNGSTLAPGSTCYIYVNFTPSVASAESATLTFTDSAGTQTLALSGTGVSTTPTVTLSQYVVSFNTQVQGTTSAISGNSLVYLYNNAATSLTLGNVSITGPFVLPNGYNTCNGQTISAGSYCYVYVEFAPTSAGYLTGTLTFNNSGGTALAGVPAVPLAGFAVAQTYTANLSPTSLNFTAQQVIGTTSSSQTIHLYNTGNTSLTVGTLTGTDFGLAGSTAEFSTYPANGGGEDYCSGQVVAAGSSCYVYVTFTPNAAGTRTGTISFPVTYGNSTTATLTANLSGNGVAEKDSAVLTPPNVSFVDQAVGVVTNYTILVYLNNSGNQPFNVGTLTSSGTNAADFSTAASNGGYDQCSGTTVAAGSSCTIRIAFTPAAAGARSATITFPVTFKDNATQSLKLTLAGTGVTGTKTLQITPGSLQFPAEMQKTTSGNQTIGVSNKGNLAVTIGTDTITGTNATEFIIASDNCTGTNLAANSGSCTISVNFEPSASATGTQTATLNIADNATGGPHAITLTGTAITASQQIVVSQTTLAFGNEPAGSTSSTQIVYVTNQSDTAVGINNVALTGSADFAIVTNNCLNQGQVPARGSCYVSANFAPPAGAANGAVTATITETDTATPGTHAITLTGTVVTAGPAVAFSPSTLTFTTQNVGSTSAAQSFSVTNTGTANLTITAVASTNSTEFPVSSDGCSGSVLTPSKQCLISVKFSPSLGGARTGTIKVTDNAAGSPQSVAVSGTGYGIPSTSFTPTSLTFGGTNIGATSATQTVTLKNTGTDILAISGITLTGVNSGDFAQTNTCPASLAPVATCVITVSFKPTAAGTRSGYVSVTDNANNLAGSVQTAPLTGTGVAVPTAGVSPTMLTFPSTNIGVTSTAQTVTITNSGTGSLTITSIVISGTNSGDYAETNTCGATLVAPPTSSCTISVTFKPTASGTRTATITITDNASPTTQTVSLTGSGVGLPAAALNTPNLTFSNQNVNSTSAAQMVTLSNSGTGALTITSIAFTGANPGDFAETNTCSGSVAAGGNCTISVTFTPTASGSRAATLTVTDNAGNVAGSTQTAGVSGIGGGVPTAGVSPTTLTFASTTIGGSTAAQMATLSNSGTGPLTISSIVIGGTNPGDFAETTTCGGTLAASSNCTISVTFTPTSAGARTANLHIVDNSGNVGSTQTVTLNGTGMTSSAPPSIVSVTPSSGTGTTQTFAAVYSDVNGSTDLTTVRILFNTVVSSAHACYVSYYPGTNLLYLENDGGTVASTGVTPGSAAQVSNSQCTLMGTGSSYSGSGNTATLNVALTFSSNALQNVYLYASSKNGTGSGWVQKGTWGTTQGPPTVVSLAPTSGTGTAQTFTAVYGDPNGIYDLSTVRMLFNTTSTSGTNACYVFYYPGTNLLYLENDGGTTLSAGVTPGSSSQVSNSQCTLLGSGSSTSISGNNLTVNTALTFSGTFLGQKNVYLLASSNLGVNTPWEQEGTWTPATLGAPSVVSLTPSSGAGATQTFAGVYSDPNGTADLATVRMLFNTAVNAASACYVLYYPGSNLLYLENDGGNGLSAGVTPGSASQVSNSQCTLTGTGSSISVSGNNVTLNLALAFSGTFVGSKNVYLYASESNATTSGWVQKGTWTP